MLIQVLALPALGAFLWIKGPPSLDVRPPSEQAQLLGRERARHIIVAVTTSWDTQAILRDSVRTYGINDQRRLRMLFDAALRQLGPLVAYREPSVVFGYESPERNDSGMPFRATYTSNSRFEHGDAKVKIVLRGVRGRLEYSWLLQFVIVSSAIMDEVVGPTAPHTYCVLYRVCIERD